MGPCELAAGIAHDFLHGRCVVYWRGAYRLRTRRGKSIGHLLGSPGIGWTHLRMRIIFAHISAHPLVRPQALRGSPRVTGGPRPRRPPNGRACAKHQRWSTDRARIRGKPCGPGGARRLVRRAAPVEASNDPPLAAWSCCVSCLVVWSQTSPEGISEATRERELRPPGRAPRHPVQL